MSKPRSLELPPNVRPERLMTSRGEFAALVVAPTTPDPPPPPVLLLPGWTGSKEDFLPILGLLAENGRRAIALDHRGQYESAGPEDLAAYTLESFGADALAVADTFEAPRGTGVHLVGHSFGGLVARSAVLTDPSSFDSITLMASGPAGLDGAKATQLRLMATALPVLGLTSVYAAKRQFERTNGTIEPLPPEIEEFLRHRFCNGMLRSLEAMTRHLIDAPDRVAELAATGVPAHVMTGRDDDVWPLEEQRAMAARLRADYVVLDEAGHSPAIEAPEATIATLRGFWDRVESVHARVGAQ